MTLPRDYLIIGGGIVGLTVAWELRRRHPSARITVVEKETQCGTHASSRNSGVLHAGFYYTADSLKARFTVEGNRRMTAFVRNRGLGLNACGKLVVATTDRELEGLDELMRRGKANGVALRMISADEARAIEPRVHTVERALFAESTSTVDPEAVVAEIVRDLTASGVEIRTSCAYRGRYPQGVETTQGRIPTGYVINAAGLYADRIAHDFGFGRDYVLLPFKGLYLYADAGTESLACHVYPVPDLRNPWLGVHFTVTVGGRVKIGPTAIPAFWREHYTGLDNFSFSELTEVVTRELGLLATNDFNFRSIALEEMRKYSRRHLARLASRLVPDVNVDNYRTWGKPGIRAQLFHKPSRRLEMDFHTEGDRRSFHVLNAVSPAFTCSFPFSEYVVDSVEAHSS